MKYPLKQSVARDNQHEMVELILEYNFTGSVTAADTAVVIQQPKILEIETESSSASGTTDLSATITSGETLTHVDANDDSDGEYNALIRVGQAVRRVVSLQVLNRKTGAVIPCKFPTAPSDCLIAESTAGANDMIAFGIDHGADLTAANLDLIVIAKFILDN